MPPPCRANKPDVGSSYDIRRQATARAEAQVPTFKTDISNNVDITAVWAVQREVGVLERLCCCFCGEETYAHVRIGCKMHCCSSASEMVIYLPLLLLQIVSLQASSSYYYYCFFRTVQLTVNYFSVSVRRQICQQMPR